MKKAFNNARSAIVESAGKFTKVSVGRGKTVYPKTPKDLENLGIRYDYDGETDYDGVLYNKFQVQPNAGKVDSTIRRWREKKGGTHAVMGVMYVKKDGSVEDVAQAWDNFVKGFTGVETSDNAGASGDGTGADADAGSGTVSGYETGYGASSGVASGSGDSISPTWVWWKEEGIYYCQANGVDEWYAPTGDVDSGWIYSLRLRKSFIKYANGAVVWES